MQFLWSPNHCNRFALVQGGIHLYSFKQLPQKTTLDLVSPIASSFSPDHPLTDPVPFPSHTYPNAQLNISPAATAPPVCHYLGSIPLFHPTQSVSFLRSTPIPATRNCLNPTALCWQPNQTATMPNSYNFNPASPTYPSASPPHGLTVPSSSSYSFTVGYESGLIFSHSLTSSIDSSHPLISPPDYNPFNQFAHYSTVIKPPHGAEIQLHPTTSSLVHVFEHPVGTLAHNPYHPNLLAATSTNQTRSSPSFVLLDTHQVQPIPTSLLSSLSFPPAPDPLISQSFGTIFTSSWVPGHPTQIVLGCKKFLRLLDFRDCFQVRKNSFDGVFGSAENRFESSTGPVPSIVIAAKHQFPYDSITAGMAQQQQGGQHYSTPSFTPHPNANQRIRQHSLRTHDSLNMLLSIDDAGRYLATNAYNGTILLYDLRMLAEIEPEVESSAIGIQGNALNGAVASGMKSQFSQLSLNSGVNAPQPPRNKAGMNYNGQNAPNTGQEGFGGQNGPSGGRNQQSLQPSVDPRSMGISSQPPQLSVDYIASLDSRQNILYTRPSGGQTGAFHIHPANSTTSNLPQNAPSKSSRPHQAQTSSPNTPASSSYATTAQFFANFFWGRQPNTISPSPTSPLSAPPTAAQSTTPSVHAQPTSSTGVNAHNNDSQRNFIPSPLFSSQSTQSVPAPRAKAQPRNILYISDNTGLCAYDLTTQLQMIRANITPSSSPSKLRPPRSIILPLNHKLVSSTQTIVSTQTFPHIHSNLANALKKTSSHMLSSPTIPSTASITLSSASSSNSLQYTLNIDVLRALPRPKHTFPSLAAFSSPPPMPNTAQFNHTYNHLGAKHASEQHFFSAFQPHAFMHSWSSPPILEIISALQPKFIQLLSTQQNLHTFLTQIRNQQNSFSPSQLAQFATTPPQHPPYPHHSQSPPHPTAVQPQPTSSPIFSSLQTTLYSVTSMLTSFTTPLATQTRQNTLQEAQSAPQNDPKQPIPISSLLAAFHHLISSPMHFLSFLNPSLRLLVGYNLDSINSNPKTLLMLLQAAFAHRALISLTFSLFSLYFCALSVCYSVLENIGPISATSLSSAFHKHQFSSQVPFAASNASSRRILDAITLLTIHQSILTDLTTHLSHFTPQFNVLLQNPLLFTNPSTFTYLNPISSQFFQQSIIIPPTFATIYLLLEKNTQNALKFFDAKLSSQTRLLSTWFYIKGLKLFPAMNTKQDFHKVVVIIATSIMLYQSQLQGFLVNTLANPLQQQQQQQQQQNQSTGMQSQQVPNQSTQSTQNVSSNDNDVATIATLRQSYQTITQELIDVPKITSIELQLHHVVRFNSLGPLHWADLLLSGSIQSHDIKLKKNSTPVTSPLIHSPQNSPHHDTPIQHLLPQHNAQHHPIALGHSMQLRPTSFLALSQPHCQSTVQQLLSYTPQHTTTNATSGFNNTNQLNQQLIHFTAPSRAPSSSSSSSSSSPSQQQQQQQQQQSNVVQLFGLAAPTIPSFQAIECIPTFHHPIRAQYTLPSISTLTSLLAFLALPIPLTNAMQQSNNDAMTSWFLPLTLFDKRITFVVNDGGDEEQFSNNNNNNNDSTNKNTTSCTNATQNGNTANTGFKSYQFSLFEPISSNPNSTPNPSSITSTQMLNLSADLKAVQRSRHHILAYLSHLLTASLFHQQHALWLHFIEYLLSLATIHVAALPQQTAPQSTRNKQLSSHSHAQQSSSTQTAHSQSQSPSSPLPLPHMSTTDLFVLAGTIAMLCREFDLAHLQFTSPHITLIYSTSTNNVITNATTTGHHTNNNNNTIGPNGSQNNMSTSVNSKGTTTNVLSNAVPHSLSQHLLSFKTIIANTPLSINSHELTPQQLQKQQQMLPQRYQQLLTNLNTLSQAILTSFQQDCLGIINSDNRLQNVHNLRNSFSPRPNPATSQPTPSTPTYSITVQFAYLMLLLLVSIASITIHKQLNLSFTTNYSTIIAILAHLPPQIQLWLCFSYLPDDLLHPTLSLLTKSSIAQGDPTALYLTGMLSNNPIAHPISSIVRSIPSFSFFTFRHPQVISAPLQTLLSLYIAHLNNSNNSNNPNTTIMATNVTSSNINTNTNNNNAMNSNNNNITRAVKPNHNNTNNSANTNTNTTTSNNNTDAERITAILTQLRHLHKTMLFSTVCNCQQCVLCALQQYLTVHSIDIQTPTFLLTYIGALSLLDADTNRSLIKSLVLLDDSASPSQDHHHNHNQLITSSTQHTTSLTQHNLALLLNTLPPPLLSLLINPFLSYLRFTLVQRSGAYKEYLNKSIVGLLKPLAMDFDFQRQHVMSLVCGNDLYTPTMTYHIPHCTSCGSLHYNDPTIDAKQLIASNFNNNNASINNNTNTNTNTDASNTTTHHSNTATDNNNNSGNITTMSSPTGPADNGLNPNNNTNSNTTQQQQSQQQQPQQQQQQHNAGSHNRLRCRVCKSTWPLCSLCYQPVGGVQDSLPVEQAFIWCLNCKHGGHVHHMVQWFSLVDTCPHPDCDCRCALRSNSSM